MAAILKILSFVFLALLLTACAATPQDRWYQQRQALNTAEQLFITTSPKMSDENIVKYGQLLQTARTSLDSAFTRLPDGGSEFDTALGLVQAILKELATWQTQGATQGATK